MARRLTNVSMLKGFLIAGLLALAGPALAAPGPSAHSKAKASKYSKGPAVVVTTQAPKGKAKRRDRVTVVAAPKVVVRGQPRVTVSYRPQVVVVAPRVVQQRPSQVQQRPSQAQQRPSQAQQRPSQVQQRPSQALRLRLERAQVSGRLNKRELRSLVTALERVEAAERRFFRGDRRLDRRELRTLARLEASFDASLEQAMRRRGRA